MDRNGQVFIKRIHENYSGMNDDDDDDEDEEDEVEEEDEDDEEEEANQEDEAYADYGEECYDYDAENNSRKNYYDDEYFVDDDDEEDEDDEDDEEDDDDDDEADVDDDVNIIFLYAKLLKKVKTNFKRMRILKKSWRLMKTRLPEAKWTIPMNIPKRKTMTMKTTSS